MGGRWTHDRQRGKRLFVEKSRSKKDVGVSNPLMGLALKIEGSGKDKNRTMSIQRVSCNTKTGGNEYRKKSADF